MMEQHKTNQINSSINIDGSDRHKMKSFDSDFTELKNNNIYDQSNFPFLLN